MDEKPNRYQKLTPEQKEKYFGENRNQKRRQAYAENPEYRSMVLQRNREAVIRRRGEGTDKTPVWSEIQEKMTEKLVKRKVRGPVIGKYNVIRRPDLAAAFKISTTTLMRWFKSKKFPEPVLFEVLDEAKGTIDRRVMYYTEEEAEALFRVYTQHLRRFRQYSGEHNETQAAFEEAIKDVRMHWRK